MTRTNAEIIGNIYTTTDLKKFQATKAVESLLDIIKETLESGEDVLVSGFGKFCVKEKKERKGRNPATGEDLMLAPRRVVTFKCSGVLVDKMSGKG